MLLVGWVALLPLSPAWAQDANDRTCTSPRVPQAWSIEDPRTAAEGPGQVLVRRQSEQGGGRGTELPIPLPIDAGDQAQIVYGDPSSAYLYLAVTPRRQPAASLRLLVLCKSVQNPRMIANETVPITFPLVIDTQAVAEEPGEAVAFVVGEDRTLVWRNASGRAEVLTWPKPVRALALLVGDDLRLTALLADGSLWERHGAVASPLGAPPARVPGWSDTKAAALFRGEGWVWLRDTQNALFALAQAAGLRLDRDRRTVEQFYGQSGERLAAWDRFYSADGQRTALFLLFERAGKSGSRYEAAVFALSRGLERPVMEFEVSGLFEQGEPVQPIVLLQAWDQEFQDLTGFVFHNPGGQGTVESVTIATLWDPESRRVRPRLIVDAARRRRFSGEILPFQVSVLVEQRRERVFFFAEQDGYMERFDDPIEVLQNAVPP